MSTSNRMHGEVLRLLFLQAHRETEAHFTAAGMPSQRNQSESFRFKCCILQKPEEQSRTCGCQNGSVEDQPQCPGMWHSSNPNARSLLHCPSAPPPSFTQSTYPPRSLVRVGRLVHTGLGSSSLVAHILHYPPPPHANSFVLGPAVIKHTQTRSPTRHPPECVSDAATL